MESRRFVVSCGGCLFLWEFFFCVQQVERAKGPNSRLNRRYSRWRGDLLVFREKSRGPPITNYVYACCLRLSSSDGLLSISSSSRANPETSAESIIHRERQLGEDHNRQNRVSDSPLAPRDPGKSLHSFAFPRINNYGKLPFILDCSSPNRLLPPTAPVSAPGGLSSPPPSQQRSGGWENRQCRRRSKSSEAFAPRSQHGSVEGRKEPQSGLEIGSELASVSAGFDCTSH